MFFEAKFLQKIVILDYVLSLIKHSNNLRNQRENSNEGGFFKDWKCYFTVLAEKILMGLLGVLPIHLERQNWATLFDSFEKYEQTKEILLLRNKVANHPALSWHSLQNSRQNDGGRDRRMTPRNMKSIWNVKKKIQVAKKNQTKVPWMEKSKAWSSEGLLRSEEVESTIDGKKNP